MLSTDRPSGISYEIICAVARRAPRNEYLLLLAHPPMTTPYTASESTARMNRTPMLRLVVWNSQRYVASTTLMRGTCSPLTLVPGSTWSTSLASITVMPDGRAAWALWRRSAVVGTVTRRTDCLVPPHGSTAIEMMMTMIMIA